MNVMGPDTGTSVNDKENRPLHKKGGPMREKRRMGHKGN